MLGAAIGFAIDCFVAWLLLAWLNPDGSDRAVIVVVAVVLMWAVQLYAAAKSAALAFFIDNPAAGKALAAQLTDEGFPPSARHDNAERYLLRVAADFDMPDDIRLRASFYIGELASANSSEFARSYTLHRAWDQALAHMAK